MGKFNGNSKLILLSALAIGMIWGNSNLKVKADTVPETETDESSSVESNDSVTPTESEKTATPQTDPQESDDKGTTKPNARPVEQPTTGSQTNGTKQGNIQQSQMVTPNDDIVTSEPENSDTKINLSERESNGVSPNRTKTPWLYVNVNDDSYQNEIANWLDNLQRGRKIDFTKSSYGSSEFDSLSYLSGMESASPTDLVLKIIENAKLTEDMNNKELDFVIQYQPIDEHYVVDYVAVGGPQDGKVIYVDKGEDRPDGVLPSTPIHRGILAAHAVSSYPTADDNVKYQIDENDISFDEKKGILTYKVSAMPNFNLVINEYDKNKKLVKTVKWDLPVNSTFSTQPDSISEPIFPNGQIMLPNRQYAPITGVFPDSFYQDLIMDKDLIVEDSSFEEKDDGSSGSGNIPASTGLSIYEMRGLNDKNKNMGYITKYITNAIMLNGNLKGARSGQIITVNAYLDYDSESNNSKPAIHVNPTPVNTDNVVAKNNNIATTTKEVNLYDIKGNLITNRSLGINTTWQSDQELTYNGVKYYQVAPGEYAKASDVYLYKDTDTNLVRIFNDGDGGLIDYLGNEARILSPATDWKTDRIALINGEEYYRVSTNEFIKVDKVQPYVDDFENLNTTDSTVLYDEHGKNLSTKLSKNRSYKTDRIVKINGKKYYRVSTNEFVKVSDIKKMAK